MTTTSPQPVTAGSDQIEYADKPEGPIAAAILAAGIGALTLGVVTTLVEASTGVADAFKLSTTVGPLSGKVAVTVGVWLIAWVILHLAYRRKAVESRRALTVSLALVALGVLGTFPTFFQLFGG